MTTLTVQVLESSGLHRVDVPAPRPTLQLVPPVAAGMAVRVKQPTRAQINQALDRIGKGHKAWPASRYCCGFGRVHTTCPLH